VNTTAPIEGPLLPEGFKSGCSKELLFSLIKDADPYENLPGNFHVVEGLATPLVMASGVGYAGLVDILLQHGAAVDMTGSNSLAPLMAATSAGHMKGMDFCSEVVQMPVFRVMTEAQQHWSGLRGRII
jgi:hypothetical protein